MAAPSETDEREFWQARLDEYLRHLNDLGRSAGTIKDYKTVLTRWVYHALSRHESPDRFNVDLVAAFLDAQSLGPGARAGYSSRIRRWCGHWQERDVRAWVVRAGEEGQAELHNLDHGVVTIGWGEFGSQVGEFFDPEKFKQHLEERFDSSGGRGRYQIWNFAKTIEIGDLVVMPQKRAELGGRRLIAIGRVTGPYEYDPSLADDFMQRRKVEWLQTDLSRDVVRADLDASMNSSQTVFSLSRHDAPYRIAYLAEHGEDPGNRYGSAAVDESELWEQRLEDYLEHLRVDRGYKVVTINTKRSILGRWISYALEHGHRPELFDASPLEGFLDNPEWPSQKTRNTVRSHIKMWCKHWERDTTVTANDADSQSLEERLEKAAANLLCDVHHLQEIVDLLEDKRQVILYGPPGTGKTYLAQELAEALAPEEEARSLVQFHPAYSYEDFFEGFRPVVDQDNQMTYKLTWGPLATLVDHAVRNPEQRHVMVIDEINRANLPRVLGELLFLLEYRQKSIQVMYRPDEGFKLPKNLWFIGTMNTADRSIALIDAAMRRRFHFVDFFPEREPTKHLLRKWTAENAPGQEWVVALVSAVNAELEKELGGDHLQLGPSHFMRDDLNDGGFKRVWRYNIEPFIEDQLFGQTAKIKHFRLKAVLQRHRSTSSDSQREHVFDEPDMGTAGLQVDDDESSGRED